MLSQAMGASVLSDPMPTTQQDKAKLMASWARSPLADREQAYAWFEANRGEAALPADENSVADVARRVDAVTPSTSSTVISNTSGRPVVHPLRNSQAERASNDTSAARTSQRSSLRDSTQRGMFTGWEESHPERTPSDPRNGGDTHAARSVSLTSKASNLARTNTKLYF